MPRQSRPGAERFGWIVLVALAAGFWGCARQPSTVEEQRWSRVLESLDRVVTASMEYHGTPGAAVGLTLQDRLLAVRSYGFANLQARVPVSAETRFQVGSITKSFTAIALMQLADEGRFDPGRPVVDTLPRFRVRTEFSPITAHNLLTHTAGLPTNRDDIPSSPFMAYALRDRVAAWEPGTRFHYSNVGYQILHAMVEIASGRTYSENLRQRIFVPLRMDNTRARIGPDRGAVQAVGHVPSVDDRPARRSDGLVGAPSVIYATGDGCIESTAEDMAAYLRMLLNRGQGPSGRILSEEAFETIITPHALLDPGARHVAYGYGLGVVTRGDSTVLRHSGSTLGFRAQIVADLSGGFGVVVLVNGPGEPNDISSWVVRAMRKAMNGEGPPEVPTPVDPREVHNAAEYSGTYSSNDGRRVVVSDAGNSLLVDVGEGPLVLERLSGDAFLAPGAGLDRYPLRFSRNHEGEVVELAHGPDWYVDDRYRGPTSFETLAGWDACVGRYRSYSPWLPYIEVLSRKGELLLIAAEEGASPTDEVSLIPLGDRRFGVGEVSTPEVLTFDEIVDGRALRVTWSGHPLYRMTD